MAKEITFLRDESGAISFEAGMVTAGVAIVIMAIIKSRDAHLVRWTFVALLILK